MVGERKSEKAENSGEIRESAIAEIHTTYDIALYRESGKVGRLGCGNWDVRGFGHCPISGYAKGKAN